MEATYFLTLRGGYVHHHSSSIHPSVTSYSLKRHTSSTFHTSVLHSDLEKRWEPYVKSGLELVTLSPLDIEYPEEVKELFPFFSNYGFFMYRMILQVKWLLKLSKIPEVNEVPKFSPAAIAFLELLIVEFRESDMHEVESIKYVTNPDARAVLNFLKEKCKNQHEISKVLQNYRVTYTREMFLTAYEMMVKDATNSVIFPLMIDLCKTLSTLTEDNADVSTLSHTHDLAQSPKPTLVKVLVAEKFRKQVAASLADQLSKVAKYVSEFPAMAYFTGEEANYIVDKYCEVDWRHVAEEFVTSLGLKFCPDLKIHMQYNTELYLSMVDFYKILDDINPVVVEGCNIESELSLINMLKAINCRTYEMLLPFTYPFPDDMALVMSYSLVRCKVILQELKKLRYCIDRSI